MHGQKIENEEDYIDLLLEADPSKDLKKKVKVTSKLYLKWRLVL